MNNQKNKILAVLLTMLTGTITGCSNKENGDIKIGETKPPFIYETNTTIPTNTPFVLIETPTPTMVVEPAIEKGNLRISPRYMVVNTNGVNMRLDATKDSFKLGQVNKGDRCTCIAEYNDWSLVQVGPTLCFIKSEFLDFDYAYDLPYSLVEEHDIVYATSAINFRYSPEVNNYNKIDLIPKDSEIIVCGETNTGWYLVKYSGKIGYVCAEYTDSLKSKVQNDYPEIKDLKIQGLGSLKRNSALLYSSSKSSSTIKDIEIYQSAEILAEANGYYLVNINKRVGYINKNDIKKLTNTCIVVDISEQRLSLYYNGDMIFTTLVSTGKNSTPTPEGIFAVKSKELYKKLSGLYDVEYWMNLDTEDYGLAGGYGLHSFSGKKGKKASHGCIREDLEDAKFVYEHSPIGTSVNIHN